VASFWVSGGVRFRVNDWGNVWLLVYLGNVEKGLDGGVLLGVLVGRVVSVVR